MTCRDVPPAFDVAGFWELRREHYLSNGEPDARADKMAAADVVAARKYRRAARRRVAENRRVDAWWASGGWAVSS